MEHITEDSYGTSGEILKNTDAIGDPSPWPGADWSDTLPSFVRRGGGAIGWAAKSAGQLKLAAITHHSDFLRFPQLHLNEHLVVVLFRVPVSRFGFGIIDVEGIIHIASTNQ